MNPREMLKTAQTVFVIDWPSRDVPEVLILAGFHVAVHGGPGPEDHSIYELNDGRPVERRTGRPPERADLVYSYRPLSELPEIVASAKDLQARPFGSNPVYLPLGRMTRKVAGSRKSSCGRLETLCNRRV